MPTTLLAVVLTSTLFVPGYLTLVIFNRRQAWTPRPDLQLFAQSIVISSLCHLPLFWLVPTLLRWSREGSYERAGPSWALLGWFVGVALITPTLIGLLASWRLERPKGKISRWTADTFALDQIGRAPTAWDAHWAMTALHGGWVSVKTKDDRWISGKFGTGSAVAFWRDGHDIFLEEEWTTDELGRFTADSKKVSGSKGVWIDGSTIVSLRMAG